MVEMYIYEQDKLFICAAKSGEGCFRYIWQQICMCNNNATSCINECLKTHLPFYHEPECGFSNYNLEFEFIMIVILF